MGETESKISEEDQILSYFRGYPTATRGHPYDESAYRYLVKKGSEGRSLWAFNRTAFFSLKEGFIIGIYALLGLIICQEDNSGNINFLKKCLNDKINNFNCETDIRKVKGGEFLDEIETKLIYYAYDFITKALPQDEIDELFSPGWGTGALMAIGGGVIGAAAGVGAAIIKAGGLALVAGKAVAKGAVIGGPVGAAIGLAAFAIFYWYKNDQIQTRKKNRTKNLNILLERIKRYFTFSISAGKEQKLKELEENNLFIIKLNFSGSESNAVIFEMKKEDSISSVCNFLPKYNDTEYHKRLRDYYWNLLILYRNFFDSISETKLKFGAEGNNFNFNFNYLKQFASDYNLLYTDWKNYCEKHEKDSSIDVPIRRKDWP